MLAFGVFRLDPDEERLWKGPTQLSVRRKPFAILRYLIAHPKRLVTHEELLEHVWNGAVVSESAVRTHLHELRQLLGEGVIETVIGRGYRFAAELVTKAAEVAPTTQRSIVGRVAELAALRGALERARTGQRQICFVTGEPGIGKTTLVDALFDELEGLDVVVARGQCIEQHGTSEAYLAVIEMLGRLRHAKHGEQAAAALIRFAPTFVAQLPQFAPEAQLADITRRAAGGTEARMVRELIEAIEAIASQHTIVVALEDLQWSDVATIDFLAMLAQRRERASLLVIGTSRRAEAQTVTHPLNRVIRNLTARSAAISIALDRIATPDLRELLATRFPDHQFPDGFVDAIDRITNGTPLFVTTMLDDLVSRQMIAEHDGRWRLTASIDDIAGHRPDSINQLIDMQLDRLKPEEQRALEAASSVGLEFPAALVAAALELPDESVDEVLDGLARRSLFVRRAEAEEWPDGTLQVRYALTHGLVQEVCLERCAPARRQRWHRLIAERLELAHGARAAEISHVLALQFARGQVTQRAIHYYVLAGARSALRFASLDAMGMYERAHALVTRVPPSRERDRIELDVLHGVTSMILRGHHKQPIDPLARFHRMIELARGLDELPVLCAALVNASIRYTTLGQYRTAAALCDEVDELANRRELDHSVTDARHSARVLTMIWQGELVPAAAMLENMVPETFGVPNFDAVLPDINAINLAYLVMLHWMLGQPDRALRGAERACRLADANGDPWTLGLSYCNLARVRLLAGAPAAEVRAPAAQVLAMPLAAVWHGPAWLLVWWADSKEGLLDSAGADEMMRALRERLERQPMGPSHLSLSVIEALRNIGRIEQARSLTVEMLEVCRERNERAFESELMRIRGELAEPTDRAAAAADYRQALAMARSTSARAFELRAAIRIAKLEPDDANRAELATVVASFTEGHATADLIEAQRLLAPA